MPPNLDNLESHHEIKKLLNENQRLLIENNEMLRSTRRASRLSAFFRFIWLLALIGSSVYVYFNYIKPNLVFIKEQISNMQVMAEDTSKLKEFYDSMKAGDAIQTESN